MVVDISWLAKKIEQAQDKTLQINNETPLRLTKMWEENKVSKEWAIFNRNHVKSMSKAKTKWS